jgi:hypothetical protein
LEQALAYLDRGWSVFPVTIKSDGEYKKPAVKWKHLQQRLPTPAELRSMFILPNLTGLAVALGPASGGLYCREFDEAEAYRLWASEYLELAKSLPTAQSKRGPHVYFRSPEKIHTKKYGDGELRGFGSYIILPPSIHQSGHVYHWIVPLPSEIPVIDPTEAGFCRNWNCTEKPERTEKTEEDRESRGGVCGFSVLSVQPLIALAVPTDSHQNHHRLFLRARGIRALEKQRSRELSQPELQKVFGAWYRSAEPFLRDGQSRDEYWFEFLDGLERVKYPLGEEAITRAWEQA